MDNGPVLSKTYDLIKGVDFASPRWGENFFRNEGREISLIHDLASAN